MVIRKKENGFLNNEKNISSQKESRIAENMFA